jgi:serine/threonine protein kinase
MVLVSDEGRALIDAFGPEGLLTSPANVGGIRTSGRYALSFYSPERAKGNDWGNENSIWSFGCLSYEVFSPSQLGNPSQPDGQKVLSRQPPYHQYTRASEIRSALSRGEALKRPSATDDNIDEINDQLWDLIMGCCKPHPGDRLTLLEIQKLLRDMEIQDDRPEATSLPGAGAPTLRAYPAINWDGVKRLLNQIQVCRTIMTRLH